MALRKPLSPIPVFRLAARPARRCRGPSWTPLYSGLSRQPRPDQKLSPSRSTLTQSVSQRTPSALQSLSRRFPFARPSPNSPKSKNLHLFPNTARPPRTPLNWPCNCSLRYRRRLSLAPSFARTLSPPPHNTFRLTHAHAQANRKEPRTRRAPPICSHRRRLARPAKNA
jgi:hypothetical protein